MGHLLKKNEKLWSSTLLIRKVDRNRIERVTDLIYYQVVMIQKLFKVDELLPVVALEVQWSYRMMVRIIIS